MAYKSVPQKGTIAGLIEDGYSQLEELGSECDEAANNFPNSSHPKAEAFSEAASTLQGVSLPDLPEVDGMDGEVCYSAMVNKDKRKGPSRSVRCGNACTMLTAAAEAIQDLIDGPLQERKDMLEEKYETANDRGHSDEAQAAQDALDEVEKQVDDLTELKDQLESDANDCEGVEFPGLYG